MPSGKRLVLVHLVGQGFQAVAEQVDGVLRRRRGGCRCVIGSLGMGGGGGHVGGEAIDAALQPVDGGGQVAKAAAGDVLLVGVVLLEHGQLLDLGVGLGQRQHGRVARGDGLDLGVGQFLAADVLGAADGGLAGHHLGDEAGLGFQRLPHIGVERCLR